MAESDAHGLFMFNLLAAIQDASLIEPAGDWTSTIQPTHRNQHHSELWVHVAPSTSYLWFYYSLLLSNSSLWAKPSSLLPKSVQTQVFGTILHSEVIIRYRQKVVETWQWGCSVVNSNAYINASAFPLTLWMSKSQCTYSYQIPHPVTFGRERFRALASARRW